MTKPPDPRLKTQQWKRIKQHWQQQQAPCARCGHPIDYTTPRYTTTPTGQRRENPLALDVGHTTPRQHDTRTTWNINDTQPEHVHCNRAHGRHQQAHQQQPQPRTTRPW